MGSRSWTAECQGRVYHCIAYSSEVNCAPETQGGEAAATTPAASSAEAPPISRTMRDGHPNLRATMRLGEAELSLSGSPTRDAERLYLTLEVSAQPSHRECPAGFLVDGAIHSLSLLQHEELGVREKLSYVVPVSLLRQWVVATRVAGRLCQEPLELSAANIEVVREFLARFDEDLAWQSMQASEPVPAP